MFPACPTCIIVLYECPVLTLPFTHIFIENISHSSLTVYKCTVLLYSSRMVTLANPRHRWYKRISITPTQFSQVKLSHHFHKKEVSKSVKLIKVQSFQTRPEVPVKYSEREAKSCSQQQEPVSPKARKPKKPRKPANSNVKPVTNCIKDKRTQILPRRTRRYAGAGHVGPPGVWLQQRPRHPVPVSFCLPGNDNAMLCSKDQSC